MEEPAPGTGRRFHLKQIIGEGAFGQVFLAEQDSGAGFRRKVAIKLLNSNVARSAEAGRRMRDEARILGLLSHRNIVTVLDLVRLGDRWAVIMEFVPGADLEQVLDALNAEGLPFPVAAALDAGAAVCAALDAAFVAQDGQGGQLRVVHRDIKPSNVRLTLDGDVKVLDFGVARVDLEERESTTRGSAWLGTERYMAPERILCESDGAPGDVYAVAATVVELLIGRPLGRTPVLEERHAPFVEESLDAVRSVVADPELADALTGLLRDALHANPERRPEARHLADSLRALGRRADGETLVEFCRRYVAVVPDVLGHQPRPASGILSEVTADTGSHRVPTGGEAHQSAPTLLPDEGAPADGQTGDLPPSPAVRTPADASVSTAEPAEGPGRQRLALVVAGLIGVGGLIAVVLLSLGALGMLGLSSGTGSGTTPAVVEPAPAPEPTPAPVVPEPAPSEPAPSEPEPAAPAPSEPGPSEPEPAPAPVQPEPAAPVPAPAPAGPRPVPVPAPAPVSVAADAPRVDKALVALPDASGLQVTCGDVTASGTASVRLRGFPAGDCRVTGTWLGTAYSTTVRIDRQREVRCAVAEGALTCQ